MGKKARIPGKAAARSFEIPRCSAHKTPTQKDSNGQWVCVKCLADFAESFLEAKMSGRSEGGVALPAGVKDDRVKPPDITPFLPNRRQRRAMGVR